MASGSNKRQRGKTVTIRLSDQEHAELNALASRAGLAAGAFMRAATFGDSGPRAQRRPPADHVALREILGHCGRIGNNLNQIARALNTDRDFDLQELRRSLKAYMQIRAAIYMALGMKVSGEESAP